MKLSHRILIVCSILLCLCYLLTSCITEKKRAKICATCTLKETIKDSSVTVVNSIPFDTAIWILNHKGKDQAFNNCDSLYALLNRHGNTLVTDSNGIKATIKKVGKRLVFKCEADSLKEVLRLVRKEKTTIQYREVIKDVPAGCDKEHKTWLDGLYKRGFWIYSILIVLCVGGWVVKKRFFP